MSAKHFKNTEILYVIDSISREKSVSPDDLFFALEEVIKTIAYNQYGHVSGIHAEIDRKTGVMTLYRMLTVVEDDKYVDGCITLSKAQQRMPDAVVGSTIKDDIPLPDMSRMSAYLAKGLIVTKLREIEVNKQYNILRDKVKQIVQGIVRTVDKKGMTLTIDGVEGSIPSSRLIKTDCYKPGDRIRAYLIKVEKSNTDIKMVVSRTHNAFLAALFYQEVPEIQDNLIEIKGIVRDHGSRAKVAVYSPDSGIDPVGALIGIKGARVQSVSNELSGEKVDIIKWSSDRAQYIINCFFPIQLSKIVIDEDNGVIDIEVMEKDLSIVIGRKGQNIRLISKLLDMTINVSAEQGLEIDHINDIVSEFIVGLDIDEALAQLLVSEGYQSIEQLSTASQDQIAQIEGLDEAIAEELIIRAMDHVTAAKNTSSEQPSDDSIGMAEDVKPNINDTPVRRKNRNVKREQYDETTAAMMEIKQALYHARITDIQTIAEMSSDELYDLLKKYNITIEKNKLDDIIMRLRQKVLFNTAR